MKNWYDEILFSCCGCTNRDSKKKDEKELRNVSCVEIRQMLDDLLSLDMDRQLADFPSYFFCPLSTEFLSDAVLVPDGQGGFTSCDYLFVQQWIIDHHTNPFNRNPLELADLKPDKALKEEIYQFLLEALEAFENETPLRKGPTV